MRRSYVAGGAMAAAAAAGVLGHGIAGRSSQLFGPSVYHGPGRRRSLALTFDDGPSEATLKLIEYLQREQVPATFFTCGVNVRRYPLVARRLCEAGHELGNHSYSHLRLYPALGMRPRYPLPSLIGREYTEAQTAIEGETGIAPTLLRPPYGLRWYGIGAVQKRLGLLQVLWTVIGHDWEWPAERIARHVIGKAGPGGIICLHDGRGIEPRPDVSQMLQAVRMIVPVLTGLGYRFETVSDLLRRDASVAAGEQG